MEPKKNPKADLEKKKGFYFQVGLIFSLLVIWFALEYKSYETSAFDLGDLMMDDIEEEIIPITEQEVKPPPPPPEGGADCSVSNVGVTILNPSSVLYSKITPISLISSALSNGT